MGVSKYLIGAIVAVLIIAALGGAYFLGKGGFGSSKPTSTPQPTTVTQAVSSSTPSPTVSSAQMEQPKANASAVIANIQDGVTSKNYAALASYMVNPVGVVLYASECCAPQTPDKAAAQLEYLNSATPPWNFQDSNPIAAQLRAKSDFFKNATVIGTASNGYSVGFTLNDQNKISAIVLVADYKLITQN